MILMLQSPYILIEGIDADIALWHLASPSMKPFLRSLIASTHKLVLSKPVEKGSSNIPDNSTLPKFTKLDEVEIYGFYPNLTKWLYLNRTISMGWVLLLFQKSSRFTLSSRKTVSNSWFGCSLYLSFFPQFNSV